jgi:NAD(P)H-hydrate epimerase
MLIANSQQIRQADQIQIQERHVPGILLMENAGRLCTEKLLALYPQQHAFLILAGPGNNGGDGLVIARYLHFADQEVQVLLSHPPGRYEGDAGINYAILSELPVPLLWQDEDDLQEILDSFSQPPLLIDALLGTGIHAELRDPVAGLIRALKRESLPVVAIDLPSGLSADTGEAINQPLAAAHTLTFQLPKLCHVITPASTLCGEVHVLDIGLWPDVIAQLGIVREDIDEAFCQRHRRLSPSDSHKGRQGHALLMGGSRDMAGSITMSTYATLRAGAGLVSVLTTDAARATVLAHVPEAMCIGYGDAHQSQLDQGALSRFDQALKGKQAIGLGPGLGQGPGIAALLEAALPMVQVPLVLDADALNALADHPDWWALLPEKTILTPHPGEMRRLTGLDNVNERRLEAAERLAQDRQVIVVLKGAGSIVALPDGRSYVNRSGNSGMATAGAGDVLTGILTGLLAQGYPPELAAPLGVYLHGEAADRAAKHLGPSALMAMDIARWLR